MGRESYDISGMLAERIRVVPDFPTPGVSFRDITPVLADPALLTLVIDALASSAGSEIDKVVGIESRGFILAAPIAYKIGAGLVPLRKEGKLPWETHGVAYSLEYGTETLEVHQDAFQPGERVLVIDDVLATGGTASAAVDLIRRCGAVVVGVSVLLELPDLLGRAKLPDIEVRSLYVADT